MLYHRITKQLLISIFLVSGIFFTCCSPSLSKRQANEVQITSKSKSVLDQIKEKGVIKVGTTGDYVPFSYQLNGSENKYYGVDIELAKSLGKSLRVNVQFVKTTWSTLLSDLNSNKFDIGMSGITITPERKKTALFSIPLLSSGKAAITLDQNVHLYRSIEAINKVSVRIIVNPGGTNESFAIKNFPHATLIQNEDNISIFQKIIDGDADVMVTDAIETLVQERIHPELEAVNPDLPFNSFEMGYLIPKDDSFKNYIDQWILHKQEEGTFKKVFDSELEKISTATKQ